MEPTRPILLNSCARAATAAEARFRIAGREPARRASRVVALDAGAAEVVRRTTAESHGAAHFLAYEGSPITQSDGEIPDLALRAADGSQVRLREELAAADLILMVATADDGAAAAAAIGEACTRSGVMTAGVVFGAANQVSAAVNALRPHAQVLLVSHDEDDVPAILAALRA